MRITKKSVYSGLAGAGVLLGVAGISAAATGTDATQAPAAIVQQVEQAQPDPSTDPATAADDESTEAPGSENEASENDANEGQENDANEGTENEADDGPESGENEGPETRPAYTSSVQIAPQDEAADETETDASEADEDAALAALATVTPDQASAAALDSQAGTVGDIELSNDDGNVVYDVEIVDDAGVEYEIVIDAGTGEVLASAVD